MMPKCFPTFLFLCLPFLLCPILRAQTMRIGNTVIDEGAETVAIPVFLSFPDSASALQLSIVWPANEFEFDTILFTQELIDQNLLVLVNSPNEGELRVLLNANGGPTHPIVLQKDSIGFTIVLRVTDQFSGASIVGFNPDFPNIFADVNAQTVQTTVIDGTISVMGDTVSSILVENEYPVITIIPNPVKRVGHVLGLSPESLTASFQLISATGRIAFRGILTENGRFELPESLPLGTYWMIIDGGGTNFVKALVVSR